MSKLLINESPLLILPSLAVKIGLNEAIVLQQLHYWLHRAKTVHADKKWVYKTVDEWRSEFPFWSEATIKRSFSNLKDQQLVLVEKLNKSKSDHTNFYTINYVRLDQIDVVGDPIERSKMIRSDDSKMIRSDDSKMIRSSLPEITTEITTENNAPIVADTAKKPKFDESQFDQFWSVWPKRKDKEAAKKAWAKIKMSDDLLITIVKAVNTQKATWTDLQFVKNPATWLNGKCWEDEILPTSQNNPHPQQPALQNAVYVPPAAPAASTHSQRVSPDAIKKLMESLK